MARGSTWRTPDVGSWPNVVTGAGSEALGEGAAIEAGGAGTWTGRGSWCTGTFNKG